MSVEQIAGQYQATPKTFGDGQTVLVQVDAEGNLKTTGGGTPGTPSSGVQSVQGFGYRSAVSIPRPTNTTAYTAGDVLGINNAGSAGSAVLTFANIGPTGGGYVFFDTVEYEIDITGGVPTGMTSFRLQLYSATPPSALLDNAVYDLPSGDRSVYLGYIDLGSPAPAGASTLYVETDQYGKKVLVPSGGSLYGYLVTNGGYTPTSGAVSKVTLGTTGV